MSRAWVAERHTGRQPFPKNERSAGLTKVGQASYAGQVGSSPTSPVSAVAIVISSLLLPLFYPLLNH